MNIKRFKRKYGSLQASIVAFVFFTMLCSSGLAAATLIFIHNIFGADFVILRTPVFMLAFFFLISIIVGVCITGLIGDIMLKPIKDVIHAMKMVEKGDYSVRITDKSDNAEISELIESYNTMAKELSGIEIFRGNFIDSFSHEFKTPIVSIQGFAKQLKKPNLSPEKREEYVDIIISESKRLTNLSSNILMLNKFENQQIITDRTEFSLTEQIRNCVLLLENKWCEKNLELEIDMEEISYVTNKEMLSQVWLNILNNAVKFSPDDEKITIRLYRMANTVKAEISDRGIGMNEETISHIFERFYQGDSAHSSEGNGLGLPLVKRIIELCNGQIRVESQYGKGTTFIVTLPMEKPQPPAPQSKALWLKKQ